MKLASLVLLVAESSRDKNFQKALNDITRKNSNIGFEYPKKSLHNSSYQKKKILAKILRYPKKSRNKKFQTQKNPSIIPVTCNPEYPPPPPSRPPGPKLPLSTCGIFELNNLISVFNFFISSYSVTGRHV